MSEPECSVPEMGFVFAANVCKVSVDDRYSGVDRDLEETIMNRKRWIWTALLALPLVIAGAVFGHTRSQRQAEGYTCPLTGEKLPCPLCCPLNGRK